MGEEQYDIFLIDDSVIDEAIEDETVAPVQYDITSFGADYDVEGLVKRLQRGDILVPSFQRDYVWNQKDASRFIESLLLGLPVPGIFLAREVDSKKLLVIDGQQRLKTLQFFYEGFFNPNPDDDLRLVFKLINVQKKFIDLTYETLSDEDRIILNDSIIHATIVKQESPEDDNTSIYHIFERLNSTGRKLTPQQIRSAIYHGNFIDLIKELNNNPNWRKIFGRKSPTLKDQELILRFLAMYFTGSEYKAPINEFLNKFAQKYRNRNGRYKKECREIFTKSIEIILNSIGQKAFRPERAINAAIFDSVMVGLSKRIKKNPDMDLSQFREAYEKLLKSKDFITATSQSTSNERNVALRLRLADEAFSIL